MLMSFFVNFFINAATAVAQAAVPHAFVNPAPRSQTLTVILFSSSICAKVTLVLSGNNSLLSIFGPNIFRSY